MSWLRALGALYRDGFRLLWLAPLVPLLAILPEFAQHVAEVRLGMFDSREAFAALAMDPARWAFGYAKIAGLVLAMLAAARFHGDPAHRWWDLRGVLWKRFAIALALNAAVALPIEAARGRVGEGAFLTVQAVVTVATLPLILYLFAALIGNRTMTLRAALTSGWRRLPLLALLLVAAFVPAQAVHQLNHTLALGRPDALVWALMVWDALLVGLLACWVGTAMAMGCRGDAAMNDRRYDDGAAES